MPESALSVLSSLRFYFPVVDLALVSTEHLQGSEAALYDKKSCIGLQRSSPGLEDGIVVASVGSVADPRDLMSGTLVEN